MAVPTAATTNSPRRRLRNVAVAVAAVVALGLGAACTPESYRAADLVNNTRGANGLPALEFNSMLHFKAQGWAEHMASQGRLSHSRLTDANHSTTWTKLGENVGVAYSIEGVHNAFMGSSGHRANILDRTYNKIGTGVHIGGDGRVWVVQEFMHEWFVG